MKWNTIGVCGAGTMGRGIAQLTAVAGFNTILFERDRSILENSEALIRENLQQLVAKSKMSEAEMNAAMERIRFTEDHLACKADVIIEAIIEDMDAKIHLFNQLAQINNRETILASNTSSLSISAIANHVAGSDRVAGLHFFNPAPLMKLVEVVKGEYTSDAVTVLLVDLTNRLGKTAVICKDSPGFIVNRVARPFYIESLRLMEEGVPFEKIDRLMEGSGFRMGPFRLMDLIGNDVNYAVSCSVYEQLDRPERLRPSDIQKNRVETGRLGKKTGGGYYDYN